MNNKSIPCDTCRYYMPDASLVNIEYYTACKERDQTISLIDPFTNEDKQAIMNGLAKKCKYKVKL